MKMIKPTGIAWSVIVGAETTKPTTWGAVGVAAEAATTTAEPAKGRHDGGSV